uniref:Reverse transcriptase zinc-binding domain-containing protein n=1 Tax=Nelumbo nucifera TaxID=4432 RepID=A0A822Y3I3_NELNU|nr:TPA_asm: hypothetical protein HUJ06_027089 [Nelumbo nucifera]
MIRDEAGDKFWAKHVWNNAVPNKIAVFAWKLINRALPTDDRIQSKGINLASRCWCCTNRTNESLHHLFIGSEMATALWSYFATIFEVNIQPDDSIYFRLLKWFRQVGCSTSIRRVEWGFLLSSSCGRSGSNEIEDAMEKTNPPTL